MRTLIIVRHGDYAGLQLLPRGRRQIEAIRDTLGNTLSGAVILTSTAGRAVESAEILAAAETAARSEAELYSDASTDYSIERVLALAIKHGMDADVVVVVTHYEIASELPPYVGVQFRIDIPYRVLDRGQGIVIDLLQKTYEYIP